MILLIMSFKTVNDDEFAIVERFGTFQRIMGYGLHLTPFTDKVIKYSKKEI